MTTHKLRATLAAASVLALGGCLDSDPVGPTRQCILNETPPAFVAGDTIRETNGLKYIEILQGDGATVQPSSLTSLCYVGSFTDGRVFDLGTFSFTPSAGEAIEGFSQGVVGMEEGGARRLIIPPALGYGSEPWPRTGTTVIPANSTLVFDVGILRVR